MRVCHPKSRRRQPHNGGRICGSQEPALSFDIECIIDEVVNSFDAIRGTESVATQLRASPVATSCNATFVALVTPAHAMPPTGYW